MVVPVIKRKTRSSQKKTEDHPPFFFFCNNLCSMFYRSILYITLGTVIFFFFIYLWLSFTTLISDKVLHICVFSRKLNDPYCVTAGSKPAFQIPINLTSTPSLKNEETSSIKNETLVEDPNKILHSQDDNFIDDYKEMGSRRKQTFTGDSVSNKTEYGVLYQEGESKNIDSLLEQDRNSDNLESFLDDPTRVLGSEAKKEYEILEQEVKPKTNDSVLDQEHNPKNLDPVLGTKDGELGSQKNDTTNILRSQDKKEYDAIVQEDKPKNKAGLSSLIDLKAEEEYNKYIKPKSEGEGNALRAVIKYLSLQRSWLSLGSNITIYKSRSCEGRGVYVYDLPSKFNRDLLIDCNDILPKVNLCSYFKNQGFGEAIESLGQGWFNTHMYSLEPILHARVLKHPCRVYNETQAKLFYVPYYGGFDVLRWHYRNVSDDVKDGLGIEVLKWLEPKESWKKNAGKDHVFVLGKITWDFRRDKIPWGSRFLALQEMQNPTKLLIERQPWQVNDIAIPHPTYFHPQTDEDMITWQIKTMNQPRKRLVSFAGAARPGNPDNIRSTLIQQCISSDQCQFLDCNNGSCKNPRNVIDLFQDSEFCLQPPGDTATRRSVFDSLISGCIPVIFSPFTAYYQYAWHLPEDHKRYSVYISEEDVKEKRINVVEELMAKTQREKDEMRSYIIYQLLPGLVYGDSDAKFEKFRDAFDITFDSLLEKINKSK